MIKRIFLTSILFVGLCFSVQFELTKTAVVGSNTNKIYPGDTVNVYFTLTNDDPYNYRDVKIEFYVYPPLEKRLTHPYDVKYDFLQVGEKKVLSFTFKVPKDAKPGDYKIELDFLGSPINGFKQVDKSQIFYIKVFDHNYFDINISKEYVSQGILNLNLNIKSLYPAKHVVLDVQPIGFDIIGNTQRYIGDIDSQTTVTVPVKFYVASLPTGVYKLKVVLNWIGQDEMEYSQVKYLNVFIENKMNNKFKVLCNSTQIERGINKLKCRILNLDNLTIQDIILPNQVIGQKVINKTNFNVTVDVEIPCLYSFCPTINYIDKDLKTKTETDCYNIKVVQPDFDIKVVPMKTEIYRDETNIVPFKITSNKKLNDLNVYVNGEIIGSNVYSNKTEFNVEIKPELKNYVIFDIFWKYKGIEYNKKYTVYFDVVDRIKKDQLFVFYDKNKKLLGVANRGKFKLYHCVLEIKNISGNTIEYKYIGDLDEDDYDTTDLNDFNGTYSATVSCYYGDHIPFNKTISFEVHQTKREQNNFVLYIVGAVVIVLVFLYLIRKII